MTNEIDAIIDAAETVSEAQTPDAPTETPAAENPETPAPETEESEAEVKDKPEDMFPKKAVNALSRRDKQIGKLKAEKQQMQQELETLRQKANPKPEVKDDAPKEVDFETYGEYLRAEARYAARQELSETQAKQTEEKAENDTKEWEAERAEAMDDNAAEARKAFSDFDKVIEKAIPKEGLAPHVKKAFLEADNPAFALLALAKEGNLEDLNDMSFAKCAMTIARYEDKGLALSKTKPVTNAPKPMTPAKGTGTPGKTDDDLVDEILAYVRK